MGKNQKAKSDALKFIPIHRLVDGVALPTAARGYPVEEGTAIGMLMCECDAVSHAEDWGNGEAPNEVGPRCPVCWAQYRADTEADVATRDTECPPVQVAIEAEQTTNVTTVSGPAEEVSADGVVTNARELTLEELRSKSQLNDEWLELELRLEQLKDKKVEFLAGWSKDEKSVKRRIGEIKGELHSIAEGKMYEPPPTEAEARQLQMFDGGEA